MNSSSPLRVQGDVKYITNQQSPTPEVPILKFSRLVAEDINLELEFRQVWLPREFQPDDELIIYGIDKKTQDNRNFLYLVYQSRVTIVGLNTTIGQEVSTDSLLEMLVVRASLSEVDSYYNPWVAHWQVIYYLLVWRVQGDRILSNSAIGKKWLSHPQFEARRTAYTLLLNFTENLNAPKGEKLTFNHYWQTLWYYRKLLRQIILTSFVCTLIKDPAILILNEETSTLNIDFTRKFKQKLTQSIKLLLSS
ncbi:MAG: hypothetical protein KME50_25325 [Nostoc desertorum CM1-VF14]|jgi:hypothetical protein|nr:hypothetical protein [Nostoc desertorum CM1-VF14]